MPISWPGKQVEIPNDHQIIGWAVERNSEQQITWVDFRIWKRPF
jgi:hypothetical protein